MTVIVYEEGKLYSDRALVMQQAGIGIIVFSKKLHLSPDNRFAVAMTGDDCSESGFRGIMKAIRDFLTLLYALDDLDPYPSMPQMATVIEGRSFLIMTWDRVFYVRRKNGAKPGTKEYVEIVDVPLNSVKVAGNCGPFYMVERALGTEPLDAIYRASKYKMGVKSEVDCVHQEQLLPFKELETSDE